MNQEKILGKLNPLTRRRVLSFLSSRKSVTALCVILGCYLLSLGSEFIANEKPLLVSYKGKLFAPAFKIYRGTDFGQDSLVPPNYKSIQDEIRKHGWMLRPLVWWGPNESNMDVEQYPSPPTRDNWLGTDDRGRDVFVRILYSFRLSMSFAVITLIFALVLGTLIGGLQGFLGGRYDLIGQRLVETWVSLPAMFVVILAVNVFEPSPLVLLLVIAIFSWFSTQYYLRAECLRLRGMDFVSVSRAFGEGPLKVFFRHVLPNAVTPLLTIAPFVMNQSILFLSFLNYMGLGFQPPTASLGELLRQGRENFLQAWWLAFYPFLALVLILVLLNVIGEGVRKAFDPRTE